jgi:hypothetical protein
MDPKIFLLAFIALLNNKGAHTLAGDLMKYTHDNTITYTSLLELLSTEVVEAISEALEEEP